MSLLFFHIFVVLIAFTMPTKENINVPGATAITSSHGVSDKPFAEGTLYFANMKMIKDLGMLPFCNGKYKKHYAIYECPFCGKHFKTSLNLVQRKETKSCGCYRGIFAKAKHTKHGMCRTELYTHWSAMKQRCNYKKGQYYHIYGGRGIIVASEWSSFRIFKEWAMSNGYNDGMYLDRINNDGNYEPLNCRWVNSVVNAQNTQLLRKTNKSGYRGVCFRFNKWVAQIQYNGKPRHLGLFPTKEQAAQAYNNFVTSHGMAQPLNKIDMNG